ncbi:hypothetical protein Acr_13g0005760 [Actinidia rufa]|uniref:Uncharacterized protein n=1 Tax=Actinidia rufa TaxID=165716 RepID=A0A7J0FKF3_9ERIC|nr:hypothetical protein Acr_13g0005760 [Actinidia rufa]
MVAYYYVATIEEVGTTHGNELGRGGGDDADVYVPQGNKLGGGEVKGVVGAEGPANRRTPNACSAASVAFPFNGRSLPFSMTVRWPSPLMAVHSFSTHPCKLKRHCPCLCIPTLLVFLSLQLSPRIRIDGLRVLSLWVFCCRGMSKAVEASGNCPLEIVSSLVGQSSMHAIDSSASVPKNSLI